MLAIPAAKKIPVMANQISTKSSVILWPIAGAGEFFSDQLR
jgi:hypothetical protein